MYKQTFFKIFIIFSFFPYLPIFPFSTDNQPNALFLAVVLYFGGIKRKIDTNLFALLAVFTFSVLLLLFSSLSEVALKSVAQYMSLFIISSVTCEGLSRNNGLPYNIYIFAVLFWFLIGGIQFLFDSTFGTFLSSRAVEAFNGGRGVTSLAPEPTFYGMMCVFFVMIGILNFRERKNIKILMLILLIQIVVFSKSSTVIFSLGLVFIVSIFIRKNFLYFCIIVLIILSFFPVLINLLHSYRIGILLAKIYNDPLAFILLDGSVNSRFLNVFIPIYGFIVDGGLPHGYDSFASLIIEMRTSFSILFSDYMLLGGNVTSKIGSGISAMLYELGWVGAIPIIILWKAFTPLLKENRNMLYLLLLYIIIMFNSITFVNSLASFIFGNVLYLSKSLKQKSITRNKG